MKHIFPTIVILASISIIFASFSAAETPNDQIQYPEGYREWTHVKTYIVGPKNPAFKFIGGFNHVYANEKAMQGYQTGEFPDGSVIVSDVVAAKEDSITIRENGRDHIDVMVKDSKKYAESNGWMFESFRGDTKSERMQTTTTVIQCVTCHKKQKDMVFSDYRK